MRNIMTVINSVVASEKKINLIKDAQLKSFDEFECQDCTQYRQDKKHQFSNEIYLFENRIPELKVLRQKVCIKTFCLVLKQIVKCLGVKSIATLDQYKEKEYFVFKNGMKYKITEDSDTMKLECDCEISKKYGIPCSH